MIKSFNVFKGILSLCILFALFFPAAAFAEKQVGEVRKYSGDVKLYKKGAFRGKKISDNNTPLFEGETVKTLTKSKAFIKFSGESEIIINELSTLNIKGYKSAEVSEGKVLFNINRTAGVRGFMVKTRTATIGVKGTQFAVVTDNSSLNIFLNKGKVTVEAVEGEFKRYVEKELDEFEAYLLQQRGEFEKYKEDLKKEFAEYVRSFTMEEGTAVSISDNEVKNIKIPEKIKEDFRLFDDF